MAKKPDLTPRSGIIDLDVVVIGVIEVKLKGKTYKLPDQVPLGVALEIMQVYDQLNAGDEAEELDTEDGEALKGAVKSESGFLVSMFEKISKIFMLAGYPEVTTQFLVDNMNLRQGGMLLKELMGRLMSQEEEAGNP